jgi:hypothetical protein
MWTSLLFRNSNTIARKNAGGNGNVSNTDSSESRYEEKSSERTHSRNPAIPSAVNGIMISEKGDISKPGASNESGNGGHIGGQYLVYCLFVSYCL